ncbi:hypothetical protein ACFT7S_07230 [Streptomyces sp. NPDC057136]|uniref:hypothetical protein n=1 Tax=Streptomyces sp. NPDC057136 TaxID=3346029 RepID=UPI0036422BF2
MDAIAQGHGQFDVERAWRFLSKGVAGVEDIAVSAPVCTALSDELTTRTPAAACSTAAPRAAAARTSASAVPTTSP